MSKRGQGVLLRSSRYDQDNLAVARLVLENPEAHPVCTVAWARALLRCADSGHNDHGQGSFAFDEGKDSRAVSSSARTPAGAGSGKTFGLAGERGRA